MSKIIARIILTGIVYMLIFWGIPSVDANNGRDVFERSLGIHIVAIIIVLILVLIKLAI